MFCLHIETHHQRQQRCKSSSIHRKTLLQTFNYAELASKVLQNPEAGRKSPYPTFFFNVKVNRRIAVPVEDMALFSSSMPKRAESSLRHAISALPLLLILYFAHKTFGTSLHQLSPMFTSNKSKLDLGGITVPFSGKFFNWKGADDIISLYAAFFTPSVGGYDEVGRLQAIAFLADLVPLQVVWMVEGVRLSNSNTITARLQVSFHLRLPFYQLTCILKSNGLYASIPDLRNRLYRADLLFLALYCVSR
jgi:hypothetical protein